MAKVPEDNKVSELPLEEATKDVIARYNKGNDMLVSAAMAARRLRERVEDGEAGEGVSWLKYRHEHLDPHIESQWLNKQLALAPPGATEADVARNVEAYRTKKREAGRAYRKKKNKSPCAHVGADEGDAVPPQADSSDYVTLRIKSDLMSRFAQGLMITIATTRELDPRDAAMRWPSLALRPHEIQDFYAWLYAFEDAFHERGEDAAE